MRAAYWLEHIVKYGSDHLKSHALEMPFYQYAMFDILAFLLLIVGALAYLLFKLIKLCFRYSKISKEKIN